MRQFKANYDPSSFNLLDGKLLNRRARALNAIPQANSRDAYQTLDQRSGVANRLPREKLHVFHVLNTDEACEEDALGYVTAPCPSRGLYLGQVRFFDANSERWVDYGEDHTLDASDLDISFSVGDKVPVYWDNLRGAWLPLSATMSALDIPFYMAQMTETPLGLAVPNANTIVPQDGHPVDNTRASFVDLYAQIWRPEEDTTWQTVGKVSWIIPYIDTQRAWDDTRRGLILFNATPKTIVRFSFAGRWYPADGDEYDKYDIGEFRFLGVGIDDAALYGTYQIDAGRVQPNFLAEDLAVVKPYLLNSEVPGLAGHAPIFSTNEHGTIQIDFTDVAEEWIIAIHYEATLRHQRTVVQRRGGAAYPWMTNIICNQRGTIGQICYRDFGFPGGPGARIDFASSGNPEVCTNCGENICGNCTWEWTKDETSEISIDGVDFWNNNDPCRETGPSDCECDEPPRTGGFYGEIYITPCYQTGQSTSTPTTDSSSTLSTISSTSSISSISSISASSSTQSLTTSSMSSTSSLGGG